MGLGRIPKTETVGRVSGIEHESLALSMVSVG